MSVAIGIAHAAWDERRIAPCFRLQKQVPHAIVLSSAEREHASTWAVRLWQWGLAQERATHIVCLNDDVEVCPDFSTVCEAMTEAVPNEVIALHTTAPEARRVQPWLRSYWCTGPGYILPRARIPDLLSFVEQWPAFVRSVNEDQVIMQWSWHLQRPVWHCVPAFVKHDTSVPSTLGYDHHTMRQAQFTWEELPDLQRERNHGYWRTGEAPLVECPWMPIQRLKWIEARHGVPAVCAFCAKNPPIVESDATGHGLCPGCIGGILRAVSAQPK